MPKFEQLSPPTSGTPISWENGHLNIPDDPIIPFIEGDGIGPDITGAMKHVLDNAVKKAYGGKKRLAWFEVYAGEKANDKFGEWLPKDTVTAIEEYIVAIKGPLTTPVGGGMRSLNVTLRQIMDLYACVRPCRWVKGTPNPVKSPEKLDVVIFRENTEDVYSGIEFKMGTAEAQKVIVWFNKEMGTSIRPDSGIGVKPISEFGTKRIVRRAIQYAIDQKRDSVTIVHKGNIMKFTEGAFRDWGYEVARDEFPAQTISEQELWDNHGGKAPAGKIVIKDRIADQMFMQVLLRPDEYSVLVMPNLNGDYLSDACAAQIGGLGMAPGSNFGDKVAFFEATHGTAPKYANKNMVNPGSLILSGVMMLEHLGWIEAADLVRKGLEGAILAKTVTYDLERQIEGATKVGTREFGEAIVKHMD